MAKSARELFAAMEIGRYKLHAIREKAYDEELFDNQWLAAYPDGDLGTADAIAETADRLLALKPGIESRFWDFHLASVVAKEKYQACWEILQNVCLGDRAEIVALLSLGHAYLAGLSFSHKEFLTSLRDEDRKGLPHTPPLTQKALQDLLGHDDRYTISNWVRYLKLISPDKAPPSTKRNPQPKRWRHVDDKVQKQILRAIQEKNPQLIWRKPVIAKRRNA